MRRRITKAFFAAAAAGATVVTLGLAASPAGASNHPLPAGAFTPSGGTPIGSAADCGGSIPGSLASLILSGQDNVGNNNPSVSTDDCAQAGYVATGRDFRFAQAIITVPNHAGDPTADPWSYVALDSGQAGSAVPDFARIGIAPCGTVWCVATVVIDPDVTSPVINLTPLPIADEGDGVLVQAYFNQVGNVVQFTAKMPTSTSGTPIIQYSVDVHGPTYTRAEALTDWGPAAVASGSPAPVNPANKTRDTQFLDGAWTTQSGAKGTFKGPWTLNPVEATSNGTLPPSGALIGQPSYLWTDGQGIGSDDAFGVWRFPF